MFAHNNLAVVLVVITLGSNQLCIASLRNTTTNPNFPEFTWSNAGDNAQLIGDVAAAANFQTIENNKVETNLETNNTETTPPEPQNDPQTEELETLREQTQHQETQQQETQQQETQQQETQQQETQQESQPPQSTSQTTTQQHETKPKGTQQKSQQPQPTSQTISGNANKKIVSDVANAAASKTAPTSSDEKFSMTAMIIGLSVGSVVLALTAIVLFLCRNKTTNNKKKRLPTVASEIMVFPPELPKDPLQIVIEYSDNRKDPLSTTCTDVPDPQDLAGTMSALTEPYYKMGVTADSQNLSRAPALSKACSDITEEPSLYMVTENNIDEI